MNMTLSVLVLAMALFSFAAGSEAADEHENIDGVWLPKAAELAGKKFPDEARKSIKLEVKEGKYTVNAGDAVDRGTVKLNSGAKPKEIDITGSEGPSKGKTILAIYERDGDALRICYDLSGKTRPAEFKTKEGTQLFLVTYERSSHEDAGR